MLLLTITLFLSVTLYISLQFSSSREDDATLQRWWYGANFFPGAQQLVMIPYAFLLISIILFFETIDAVIFIRLPYIHQNGFFALWTKTAFTVMMVTIILGGLSHYAFVEQKFCCANKKLPSEGSSENQENDADSEASTATSTTANPISTNPETDEMLNLLRELLELKKASR